MAYKRKTVDCYDIQGDYGHGDGFETVCSASSWKEAKADIKDHRENEPGIPFRIKKYREKIV